MGCAFRTVVNGYDKLMAHGGIPTGETVVIQGVVRSAFILPLWRLRVEQQRSSQLILLQAVWSLQEWPGRLFIKAQVITISNELHRKYLLYSFLLEMLLLA